MTHFHQALQERRKESMRAKASSKEFTGTYAFPGVSPDLAYPADSFLPFLGVGGVDPLSYFDVELMAIKSLARGKSEGRPSEGSISTESRATKSRPEAGPELTAKSMSPLSIATNAIQFVL